MVQMLMAKNKLTIIQSTCSTWAIITKQFLNVDKTEFIVQVDFEVDFVQKALRNHCRPTFANLNQVSSSIPDCQHEVFKHFLRVHSNLFH